MSEKHLVRSSLFMSRAVEEMAKHLGGEVEGIKVEELTAAPARRGRPPKLPDTKAITLEGSAAKPRGGKPVKAANGAKATKATKPAKVAKTAKKGAPAKARAKRVGKAKAAPAAKPLGVQTIIDALSAKEDKAMPTADVIALFPSSASAGAALHHGQRQQKIVVADNQVRLAS